MKNTCKTCTHSKPTYKGYRCEIKGKKTKLTDTCKDWSRKAGIILLALILSATPLTVHAQGRDWWPDQVEQDDYYHNLDKFGEWPGDVITNETMIETVTFRPKVLSAVTYSKSTKITVDATTAARVIIVRYTTDGKHWEQRSFRNMSYKGPVTAHRKWQVKAYVKENRYSSWCARQFKQAGKTIDYKKTAMLNSPMAQLYFDDHLIDGIRRKVASPVTLNIPVRARRIRIRYAYTGLKRECYSEWAEVKAR
ncbi:MAG: hypothetical protein J6S50_00555 [Oscillospiraceae bacterium]|nr:hypothetical protein [Kiritimatiellia bacterium]MBO7726920.1 hypothetical protein [Oscillospiraceae bacterium]MBO7726992.1 hypothetical protein [Oscillospiraceae bacterium]